MNKTNFERQMNKTNFERADHVQISHLYNSGNIGELNLT
jgi:hypothetical protein